MALGTRITDAVWRSNESMPASKAWLMRVVRMLVVLVRDLSEGQLTLRAMSLVYTTLLSIVPLLALSFSVLKGFGVYNQIEPLLLTFLEPLGEKGVEITERIIQFIANMNVGVLGSVGLALLIYTAVSLVQKIEEAFNFIWHIAQPRRFGERFSRYLTMLLVGPILVFAALGITASVMSAEVVRGVVAIEPFGQVVYAAGRLVPYVLVIGAFTFAYIFIPNAKVRLGPALVGGFVGGILWQTAGWAFAEFVALSGKYTAIYSSLAILILFMIWLYLSWLILLFGASVAFYYEHPEYLVALGGEPQLSNRMRERLALGTMSLIAGRFVYGKPPLAAVELSRLLNTPLNAVQNVLDTLERNALVSVNAGDPPAYSPARDVSTISVRHLLDVVRAAGEKGYFSGAELPVPRQVERALARLEAAAGASVEHLSARDLVADPADPAGE
ncbi:MAG: YihY/virulence factor BrkB family protein [Betaproteobacteria bacterium]|nr:YihY/virulence factor BrkB family protein [Betaproteobacteria bacterium]MDH3435414.1 YihY/virulence factor BrkB family protein [Betaproteobacteria bacterium]